MQAVLIEAAGGIDTLIVKDVPKPETCAANEVIIKVMAAGINPVDIKLRDNGMFFDDAYPAILGCDGAGFVEKVGSEVDTMQAGDAVYYCYGGLGQKSVDGAHSVGNYAEYVVVKAAYVTQKPASLDFDTAAASPLILITAWEALFDRAQVQTGQKVFIHAGAGGVGHVAIQLAKLAGAEVATTVSSDKKASFVRELGADLVINYKTQNVSEELLKWTDQKGVDVAFDTVGGEAFHQLVPAMRLYGDLVTILQIPEDVDWKVLRIKNVRVSQTLMLTPMLEGLDDLGERHAAILEQCSQFFDERKLSVYVDETFPLARVKDAHLRVEQGHQSGKVVLQMHLEDDEGSVA
ncbi:MAG: zinc-dependent alcohol dehydrogenase family protein [Ghiorsea sp.]